MTTRDRATARLTAPGQRFEIRTENVQGTQIEVFANRQRSLGELLGASVRYGDRDYLLTEDSRMSFAEHYEAVTALAAALRDRYGIGKGDRVAILAANCPEWIVTFWATTSLGAIAVGMNSMWAAPEVAHGIALVEPALVVTDAKRRALAGDPRAPVLSMEEDLPALIGAYRGAPQHPGRVVDEDDPAVILFTSGTTGRPKGATHSHRNMIAALWFHLLNDAVATELGHPPAKRKFLLAAPLFHIAALHNLTVPRLAVGDTAVLHLGRFDIERVLRLIERHRVTNWGAVPTMLHRLLEFPDLKGYDLSSLRTISVSSAPSSPELKERTRVAFPRAAASLSTTYGCTESSTAVTFALPEELRADPDTVGRAVPTAQVEVRDSDGKRAPDGTEGEIWLRGPQIMLGYWRDPEATAAASGPEGWFRTGDLGTMVDGRLRTSARRSDLILRGGENIYPAEVEHQLLTHPAVAECIVLGVPDRDLGQAVGAVVVVRPNASVTVDQLRDYMVERLARYKVPTRWRITTESLPRNATGKVNRTQVTAP